MTKTARRAPTALFAGLAAAGILVSSLGGASAHPETFSELANRVSPSVVNIATSMAPNGPEEALPDLPFEFPEGSPFEEFFRQFRDRFGPNFRGPVRPGRSVGSGFIIDAEGYIVTNNHVIDGADEITVTVGNDEEYKAELIGRDPQTDLALLKIDAKKDLPHLTWGDSDEANVGDWVMAVGNPFGLGGTVTAGIVSARGRNINAGPFDDFLQIDAPVNPGNSGGPTFNVDGEVIGINTAISSPNGGSVGIGFAIPSNLARPIIEQLKTDGQVARGWLGVRIQPVTEDLATALGLDKPRGALVAEVLPGSPAEDAKLKAGDVIVEFDGKPVDELRDLPRLVAATKAGRDVAVGIWRNKSQREVEVTIGKQTPEALASAEDRRDEGPGELIEPLGARVATINAQLRQRLGLENDSEGVVVIDIERGGRAAGQGLRVGDVIREIDGKPVTNAGDVREGVEAAKKDGAKTVLVLVERNGNSLFLGLKLGVA